jgi:hypothetical protein
MEDPLSTTVTIPADVARDVRRGLFCLLGNAAEWTVHHSAQPRHEYHPDWFEAPRDLFERAVALLDVVGWNAGAPPVDIDVELGEHGKTLKEAVDDYLPVREDQEREADLTDSWRAEHGKPPKKQEVIRRLRVLREFAALLDRRLEELA